jgi:hypothetical protein
MHFDMNDIERGREGFGMLKQFLSLEIVVHTVLYVSFAPLYNNRFSALTCYPVHVHKCLSLTRAINFFLLPFLLSSPDPLVTQGVKGRM